MYRYLLVIITCIVVGTSCRSKLNYFEIEGKVLHATGKKLYLKQITIGNKNPILIDTTLIKFDGSFTIKTFMPIEQDLFVLTVENGPDVYLVNDANHINVQLDINNYKQYTTDGSASSTQLHSFLNNYSKQYPNLISKIKAYDSLQTSTASDSIVAISKQNKAAELEKINTLISNNLKISSNPAVHSYLLAKCFATMDKENIRKQIADSRQRFQHYQPIIFLETIIKQQSTQVTPSYSLLNKQAPSFSMVDNFNKEFNLDSLRGKYVLLNFWASWNQQSKEENQTIARAYRVYKHHNLEVVGVSFDSTMNHWKRAIDNDNLYWKQVADFKEMQSPLVEKYKIKEIPFNVIIDTTGKIIAANLKGRDLTLKLNEVLPK